MKNDDFMEHQYRDHATIAHVERGTHHYGFESVTLTMQGESWSQGFGMLAHKTKEQSADFLDSICRVFGTEDRERLVGMKCEVLRDFPYNNEPIAALRSIDTGRTFSIDAWMRSRHPEVAYRTPLDEKKADTNRRIQQLRNEIYALQGKLDQFDGDYREIVDGEAP